MSSISEWKAFLAWLKATEAWQIFVVRAFPPGEKRWLKRFANGMSLGFSPLFLAAGLNGLITDATDPVLDLEQMDKRSGVLLEVHTPRRGGDYMIIRTEDGHIIKYEGSFGPISNKLRRYEGRPITVWGQQVWGLGGASNIVNQIEADHQLIRDFREIRIHRTNFDRWNHKLYGTLVVLGALLPLRVWWKNRKPTVSNKTPPTYGF